ncbi:MAG: elongation factor P [Clostridiaceae bacterium]|nr:elongation factor P [Clostridiaceae bacterium]
MSFILAGDFRKGITFQMDGNIMVIVEFQHVKPGKGAAFVRTKIRNVVNGSVLEKTFNPTEKFELAMIETRKMEYLYSDGGLYYFMDNESYEQIPLNHAQVEEALNFVKENMTVTVKFFNGAPFSVEPPNFVELLITECEPGVKGDTATGGSKPATLETGYIVQVPFFVNEGDVIRVDTRTGEYMSRV